MPISIHAPAKGATASPEKAQCAYTISIHAPAKGATVSTPDVSHCPRFQSTLPRRERPLYFVTFFPSSHISIHAPAKGATFITCYEPVTLEPFQSTLPRRERLCISLARLHNGYFNPRSREGSDPLVKHIRSQVEISIHAPAKGATQEISEIWLDT